MSCEINNQNILWLAVCYMVTAEQGWRGLAMLLTVRPTHPNARGLTVSILLCCGCHQAAYFYSYSLVSFFFSSEIEHCCAKENRRNNDFEEYAETQILLWGPKWQEWDRQQQLVYKWFSLCSRDCLRNSQSSKIFCRLVVVQRCSYVLC